MLLFITLILIDTTHLLTLLFALFASCCHGNQRKVRDDAQKSSPKGLSSIKNVKIAYF